MKNRFSNKLSQELAHLSPDQLEQLIGRAKAMKRRSNSKDNSLETWVERVLRKDERTLARAVDRLDGLIVSTSGLTATAEANGQSVEVQTFGQPVVVGDTVTMAVLPDQTLGICDVHPRRTKLSRPDVDVSVREQVFVANIDSVVIVVSVVTPPLHPRLIDRYLIAIQQGGAEPLIFVNKLDLLQDRSELDQLEPYREIGIQVIRGSATSDQDPLELRKSLEGKTCAFVGHSGVGKSSLVNKLKPDAGLEVGGLSEGYGRGTHTTVSSSLHRLEDGTVLIDTPGIRSFGLMALQGDQIGSYFSEFEAFQCKFSDCSHLHEPQCGVIAAVEQGDIEQVRYDAYRRLREELE